MHLPKLEIFCREEGDDVSLVSEFLWGVECEDLTGLLARQIQNPQLSRGESPRVTRL